MLDEHPKSHLAPEYTIALLQVKAFDMIRRNWNSNKWLLTTQVEHARIAGLLAATWSYPGERPDDQALQAVSRHDDGWKDCDENPLSNRQGQPASFLELAPDVIIPCWNKTIDLLKDDQKFYAAALASAHYMALAENADLARLSVRGAAAMGAFIGRTRIQIDVLKSKAAESGTDLGRFDFDLRLLQVCDQLSLMILTDFKGQETISNVPYLKEGDEIRVTKKPAALSITVDPFPFKNNLRDHATSWLIPAQEISGDELGDLLRNTKQTSNELHVGAGA